MKIKTSELTGAALDFAVAKSQGRSEIRVFGRSRPTDRGWVEVRFNPEPKAITARFNPSDNWSQAGPIIERKKIEISPSFNGQAWVAHLPLLPDSQMGFSNGPTPLIAAMRCYVVSKMGDEVEIPDELC